MVEPRQCMGLRGPLNKARLDGTHGRVKPNQLIDHYMPVPTRSCLRRTIIGVGMSAKGPLGKKQTVEPDNDPRPSMGLEYLCHRGHKQS